MAMPSRAWSSAGKKARNHPSCRRWNCRRFSACFQRKDKDLAGINTIWISDLVLVRFVNDCVTHAFAVGDTADAPEAVAAGYDPGRDLGLGGLVRMRRPNGLIQHGTVCHHRLRHI